MEVGVGSVNLHGLVPDDGLKAKLWLPMKLDERGFTRGGDQAIGMNSEPFHEAESAGDSAIGHGPHDHVHAFRHEGNEVPKVVVSGLCLWEVAVGLGLGGMNEVGKLEGVLDEEHGNVVADDVPITLLGVELDGKTTDVSREIGRPLVARDGREPHEGRRLFAGALKEVRGSDPRQGLVVFEVPVRAKAPGVHDTLWNPFVIEMKDLLAEVEVLERGRAAGPAQPERILVVRNGCALLGCEDRYLSPGRLMKLSAAIFSDRSYCRGSSLFHVAGSFNLRAR